MSDTSRRTFLAAAGTSAATAGALALGAGPGAAAAPARRSPGSAREAVVAYVKDHRSSTLRLMVGEREVVLDDPDLVTRILNAAGGQ